jgi:hypothetical protein
MPAVRTLHFHVANLESQPDDAPGITIKRC